jgi:3-dehydroquinate dehydratase
VAKGTLCGFGVNGYALAIGGLAAMLGDAAMLGNKGKS